jgi:hypothetical protein
MNFIELTDSDGDLVLFNLDHVSAIYRVQDHTRVITTDCKDDDYYDVKESVQTIAVRIQLAEVPIITNEKHEVDPGPGCFRLPETGYFAF